MFSCHQKEHHKERGKSIMRKNQIIIFLLTLGLIPFFGVDMSFAQRKGGSGGERLFQPNSSACQIKSQNFSSSGGTWSTKSQACFDRQDFETMKTWAVSELPSYPSGEWWHQATVKAFDGITLLGTNVQAKSQSTGVACPIYWATTENYITVKGFHEYDVDTGSYFEVNTVVNE